MSSTEPRVTSRAARTPSQLREWIGSYREISNRTMAVANSFATDLANSLSRVLELAMSIDISRVRNLDEAHSVASLTYLDRFEFDRNRLVDLARSLTDGLATSLTESEGRAQQAAMNSEYQRELAEARDLQQTLGVNQNSIETLSRTLQSPSLDIEDAIVQSGDLAGVLARSASDKDRQLDDWIGTLIHGYLLLALLPIQDEHGDTTSPPQSADGAEPLRNAINVVTAAGWMLTPDADFRTNYELLWSVFEAAINAGIDTETEQRARWYNKMISEWWQHDPGDQPLLDDFLDRLYNLLPAAFGALGYAPPPPALIAAATSHDETVLLGAINTTMDEAANEIAKAGSPALAPPPRPSDPKVAKAIDQVSNYLDEILPASKRFTETWRSFAATIPGRAMIRAAGGIQVAAGAAVGAATAGPLGGAVGVGLSVLLGKLSRFLLSRQRLKNPDLPGQIAPPTATPEG